VPTGARLLLVRHGEAYCNANGIVGGPQGCGGLTDLGISQAHALRERLERSGELDSARALYTSTLPRAIETAAIIAPALPGDLVAVRDCELCELHPGEADGLSWPEFVEKYGEPDWDLDPSTPLAPGADSWTGFYERCRRALRELAQRHPGELVVVVAHGGVIEQALKLVNESAPGARLRLRTENCSMTEVEFRDERWHLLRYNDRAPLTR
jgi:probable phosphoglycerate mutase